MSKGLCCVQLSTLSSSARTCLRELALRARWVKGESYDTKGEHAGDWGGGELQRESTLEIGGGRGVTKGEHAGGWEGRELRR